MENSTKFTITIFSIFLLFGCGPSPEEIAEQERLAELEIFEQKKVEVQVLHNLILLNLQDRKPCINLDKFKDLKELDELNQTYLFEELTKEKIGFYSDECEKYTELNSLGNWIIVNYKDDFGELTGKKGLNLKGEGSFSNSATSYSPLSVAFAWNQSDSEFPTFVLYEYDKVPVMGIYSDRLENTMNCRFRDSKGNTRRMDLYQRQRSNRFFAIDYEFSATEKIKENTKIFKNLVREGDKIMFVCKKSLSEYKFTLDFKYAKNARRKANK